MLNNIDSLRRTIGKNYRRYSAAMSCYDHNRSVEDREIIRYVDSLIAQAKRIDPKFDAYLDWQDHWLEYSHL